MKWVQLLIVLFNIVTFVIYACGSLDLKSGVIVPLRDLSERSSFIGWKNTVPHGSHDLGHLDPFKLKVTLLSVLL